MKDVIQQLKDNEKPFSLMSKGMQAKAEEIGFHGNFRLYLGPGFGGIINNEDYGYSYHLTYQLKSDYQPQPDTPVFEGYVLCEVKEDEDGWIKFDCHGIMGDRLPVPDDDPLVPIDMAPRFGCCGYVPKEKIRNEHIMLNAPFCYVDRTLNYWSVELTKQELKVGYIPATLGWVAFKETE